MKKIISIVLVLSLILSMTAFLAACGKTEAPADTGAAEPTEETAATAEETEEETAETEETETEEDANLPKAGDTVKIGTVSVTIPEEWTVKEYNEGESIEIQPANAFIDSVEITLHDVHGDEHAKEWADNINGNYGGDKEIDTVEIGGKTFYRVKAKDDQNVCFADVSDKQYVEVSVMFMAWEKGEPVLSTIAFE